MEISVIYDSSGKIVIKQLTEERYELQVVEITSFEQLDSLISDLHSMGPFMAAIPPAREPVSLASHVAGLGADDEEWDA